MPRSISSGDIKYSFWEQQASQFIVKKTISTPVLPTADTVPDNVITIEIENGKPVIPQPLLFTGKDGKTYDFRDFARNLVSDLQDNLNEYDDKNTSWATKVARRFLWSFEENTPLSNLNMKLSVIRKKIEDTADIKTLFEELTGFDYSEENLHRLINNNIQLKISDEIYQLTKQPTKKPEIVPVISDDYYKAEHKNIKLNNNEKKIYNNISKALDDDYKKKLSDLLQQGKLTTEKDSNGLTILENLNKIITTPRFEGIENSKILKECIDIIEKPSIVTQMTEDIPDEYKEETINRLLKEQKNVVLEMYNKGMFCFAKTSEDMNKTPSEEDLREYLREALSSRHVGTCAAATIEYDLASKYTAEFIRMVEGLTSSEAKVIKKVKPENKYMMNFFETRIQMFKTNYKKTDNNSAVEITLNPDKEALNLAKIQNNYKDENERSIIDILFQSMIMNLGSGNTYNSLTDKREPSNFSPSDSGLIEFEIGYVKEILTGTTVFSSLYRTVENKKLETIKSKEEIKQEIYEALNNNENIVVGYVFEVGDGEFSGHEITVIGQTQSLTGEKYFICQDSDDLTSNPVSYREDFILDHIHHASFADINNERTKKMQKEFYPKHGITPDNTFVNNPFNNITLGLPVQPMGLPPENREIPLFLMPNIKN